MTFLLLPCNVKNANGRTYTREALAESLKNLGDQPLLVIEKDDLGIEDILCPSVHNSIGCVTQLSLEEEGICGSFEPLQRYKHIEPLLMRGKLFLRLGGTGMVNSVGFVSDYKPTTVILSPFDLPSSLLRLI
jgi:hypothetical protein